MLLAIIPARGGSKGITRKNLALLAGKPLIQYTIVAAQNSKLIDEILLSTDDDEIANFGESLGLEIRYRRPKELAADTTPMINSLEHGIHWFNEVNNRMPEHTILLQPTSPLRSATDIDNAVAKYYQENLLSLVSVHEMKEHPFECITGSGKAVNYLIPPPMGVSRRQDYSKNFYYINGAIYIASTALLLAERSFIKIGETYFHPMPIESGIDVDTPLDLISAETFMNMNSNAL